MSILEFEFVGRKFRFDDVNGMDRIAEHMSRGIYEPPLPLLLMATLLRTEGHFVDVGANTGLYSVLAATIGRAAGREFIAFEPFPDALLALKRNLGLNDVLDSVQIVEVALSDRNGSAALHIPDQSHGLLETSASLEPDFQRAVATVEVSVKTLDEVKIQPRVGVIKVDIEGHESSFLRGARNTILRDRPIIFGEVVGPARRHEISSFLREVDYVDFRLRPDLAIHDGPVLFDNSAWNHAFVPRESLDQFRTACESCGITLLRRYVMS